MVSASASYRAPELIYRTNRVISVSEGIEFNNKIDMWSLGCIIYELLTQRRAFLNDIAVMEYKSAKDMTIDISSPGKPFDARTRCILTQITYAMLEKDVHMRPSSTDVLAALHDGNEASSGRPSAITISTGPLTFLPL